MLAVELSEKIIRKILITFVALRLLSDVQHLELQRTAACKGFTVLHHLLGFYSNS